MHGTAEPQEIDDPKKQSAPPHCVGDKVWYALLVVSGAERKICIWLRRRGYRPYWPRFKGQVKFNRHRRAIRWKSVIPGYLFLPHDRDVNWRLVEGGPEVSGFMRNAGEIIKIPENGRQGIEQIVAIEAALNDSPIAAADGMPFKVGQMVRVPRLSMDGKVVAIERGRKLIVELYFLGAKRPVPLPASEVEGA